MDFPLRAAALDVGSNAIRYHVVEFGDQYRYAELENHRAAIRLGRDAFTSGTLSEATLAAAVSTAVQFRDRLDAFEIEHYRAIATSAVRDSLNGDELVERILIESGVQLETITGVEEARLVCIAVQRHFSFDHRPWVLADLGGGSIEISVVSEKGIHASESHPMGTVRLLKKLAGECESEAEMLQLVTRHTSRLSLPEDVEGGFGGIILTGGNADALADLIPSRGPPGDLAEIRLSDLQEVRERLSSMTFRQRVETLNLREDRADVIVPATAIFERVAELASSDRIILPRVGVKDGVLLDLAAGFAGHRTP